MKKLFILSCILLFSISAGAQSLLWKVSGNGLKTPSYIFGTHHLAPLSILDKVNGFKEAFDASKQVVGELNMKDAQSPEGMKKMQDKMFITNDTTAQILFSDTEQATINSFLKANMFPPRSRFLWKRCKRIEPLAPVQQSRDCSHR